MPVYVTMFDERGTIQGSVIFDTVRNPADLRVSPEEELQHLVQMRVGWRVDVRQGTLYERRLWSRADTLVRFRRAIAWGSAIIFRGRTRPMHKRRIETYERIIQHFESPPYVIADDPGIALCLDIGVPTGP